MKRAIRTGWLCLLVIVAATCGDDFTGPQTADDVSFAPSLGIDLSQMTRLASGVYIQTLTEGTGERELTRSDAWSIHYRFWLSDGTFVEEGPLRRETDCPQGCIEGFEEGIVGLRLDEVRRIVIPSVLGYGGQEVGPIPANSVLVYEVRLDGLR